MHSSPKVFITGASSGIGSALARLYASQGAVLGLVARRGDYLATLANALTDLGASQVFCYPLDVTDAPALRAAAEDFIAGAGGGAPDIVVANAGVSSGTLTECAEDLAIIRRIFDVNVYGMAATFAPFIAVMRQSARDGQPGRLVGIASVAGIRGLPGAEAYSASKSAAMTYLESLRLEMRESGIKVVTIAPGYVETPMTAINPYPMPFLLTADDAARRIARAIERGTSYAVIPWQMGIVAKLLRLLPDALYDRLFAHAPRKPRVL
ncbi:SDR family oxidoreductase [Propionivibrio sp.]|uniref:SDR family oxidoreductase n=1 Tax=Propionivibrio sp. TaxID=2212460 RepID=UPI0025DB3EE2|nr:SDR family oxidoreductase [Propionivibrio sp.]MBK7355140.1 SDR family oxidoreductase [Propionivibrio sp.]MBK8399531.1 SDR family oxidoreductase [Propionivibrio sp.]MBK8745333.1 SDR family oxidoreductase [Propionivibrio sp.]MBK8893309.1 SDR family oxidoreductase [Propionivibrio sp.]MBL0208500.1 SDR family oxidoreductase [Propionivibrio sp.]